MEAPAIWVSTVSRRPPTGATMVASLVRAMALTVPGVVPAAPVELRIIGLSPLTMGQLRADPSDI